MTPSLFTCTCLLLPYCVLLTFSTGELEFYRDGVPESTEDIALRQFARYLEAQGHQHRSPQRSHFSQLLASQARKKHHLELNRLKERDLLEALAEKANLADLLRKEKLQSWNYHRQYNQPINELPSEREYDLSYYEPNPPVERNFEYPSIKLPYLDHKPSRDDNDEFKAEDFEYPRDTIPKHSFYEGTEFQRGMKEEPTFQFPRSYDRSTMDDVYKDNERKIENTIETTPEFTFKFDDSNLNDKHPFAVKPNDPRYYQDGPFSSDNIAKLGFDETLKNDTKWEKAESEAEEEKAEKAAEANEKSTKNEEHNFKHVSMVSLPELERRTEHHPLVVPVNHDINNDIYFIAIVAGCSAAAMFILVLISLTWCRLQRGAKAAADIEYPAYGVTGPNKDVSPSGDQRLAQSAQMYHFQHQKQQIIAMENRTSATRDPGSVSEAESDEENEEGDYTVYECPGLASTGEMEVKNPLFHDDPTPATPAQANKEEDHI